MAEVLTQFDPSAKTTDMFQATFSGQNGGKLSLWNESNVGLFVAWKDSGRDHQDYLPPWTAILINICSTSSLKFTWTQALILSSGGPPASKVIVVQYLSYENVSTAFPIPLARQTNVGNALNLATSTSLLQNDGNAAGTQIIEATPSTDAGSAVTMDNDGVTKLGNTANSRNAKLTVQGTSGTSMVVDPTQGNDVVLSQTGKSVDILGQLIVTQNLVADALTFLDNNAIQTDGAGRLELNQGAKQVSNGTSGTVSFYCPLWGSGLKVLVLVFNGFADNISAHTFALPSTISWGFWANGNIGVGRIQFQSGGVSQTLSQISAIGSGNGSSVGVTNAGSNAIGQLVSTVDTVFIATSAQGASSSIFVLIGV